MSDKIKKKEKTKKKTVAQQQLMQALIMDVDLNIIHQSSKLGLKFSTN